MNSKFVDLNMKNKVEDLKQECPYENLPFNKETESALKNVLENKNLVKVKNVKQLFNKAGIKC